MVSPRGFDLHFPDDGKLSSSRNGRFSVHYSAYVLLGV